eukprot:scaffold115729_cov26-Tisochrysis_lutea.AAC.2
MQTRAPPMTPNTQAPHELHEAIRKPGMNILHCARVGQYISREHARRQYGSPRVARRPLRRRDTLRRRIPSGVALRSAGVSRAKKHSHPRRSHACRHPAHIMARLGAHYAAGAVGKCAEWPALAGALDVASGVNVLVRCPFSGRGELALRDNSRGGGFCARTLDLRRREGRALRLEPPVEGSDAHAMSRVGGRPGRHLPRARLGMLMRNDEVGGLHDEGGAGSSDGI